MVTGIKTAVLKFDHIEIKDGGVYICKAVNEEGEDSRQIIVSVVGMM
jgi:immunoglobulin I-set domain